MTQVPSHAAGIAVAPDGKHVYVTNRGHDSIAGFAIATEPLSSEEADRCGASDAVSGLVPTPQGTIPSGGRLPWTIAFVNDALVVVSNQYAADEDAVKGALEQNVTKPKIATAVKPTL